MLNLSDLNNKIGQVLDRNGLTTSREIKDSVERSYPANDYMYLAGRTVRHDVDGTTLSIYGRANFENTELGIPPMTSFSCVNRNVRHKIYLWTFRKGMTFESDRARKKFAYFARKKIFEEGTSLYKRGGNKNIYTDKVPILVDRIKSELGDIIINTKILD